MAFKVNSYKHLDPLTTRVIKAWSARGRYDAIPWTPLRKPLSESKVALLSSAAIALNDDKPFDQERERNNPWWGDPSYRVIPSRARTGDVKLYHLHIDTRIGERDLNCVLPLQWIQEFAEANEIGEVAPSHYSMMGYILDETELLVTTAPSIASQAQREGVDVMLLVPV